MDKGVPHVNSCRTPVLWKGLSKPVQDERTDDLV